MAAPHEAYQVQDSLSNVFDNIGLTQEIKDDFTLIDMTPQEEDQLFLLIEKFEVILEKIHPESTSLDESLDQRLLVRLGNYYYYSHNDEDQALKYYKLSNRVEENEWAYFNSAKILMKLKSYESAFDNFEQAIKLKPDFPQAFRHQAEILLYQGNENEALEKLKKSQKLNPNDPETNKLLAKHFLNHGEKDEALMHLKAIHHRDSEVSKKIEELEQKKSLLARFTSRFYKKSK